MEKWQLGPSFPVIDEAYNTLITNGLPNLRDSAIAFSASEQQQHPQHQRQVSGLQSLLPLSSKRQGTIEKKSSGALHDRQSPSGSTSSRHSSGHKENSREGGSIGSNGQSKRRCVSTACIACRKRKSKCDGNTPSCAACSSVYGTPCIYDPNSDHRRKGVYKKDGDSVKSKESSLRILMQGILALPEDEVGGFVQRIRLCDNLDDLAESLSRQEFGCDASAVAHVADSPADVLPSVEDRSGADQPQFDKELSSHMGKLVLDNGALSIIGGTSNLVYLGVDEHSGQDLTFETNASTPCRTSQNSFSSWTQVLDDPHMVMHLMNLYFTWHYTYFTTLPRALFWRDFKRGKDALNVERGTHYCSELLVNAMLALGCHFTTLPAARANPLDSATAGDHFFREAKRLILEFDEHEKPSLTTVQALALMSVREAGCGREARGWVYSGMSFRMACDLGLNLDAADQDLNEEEVDARRITIWGCFLFDKCWSNYLGRQPQLPASSITCAKFDVFPSEDAELWHPYVDEDSTAQLRAQPARTRAVALQISKLCAISSDLIEYFYHPNLGQHPMTKQLELSKLGEIHIRLEDWRKQLPREFDAKEGQLPHVLVMHMFYHLLFIHLFRPFLKYNKNNSPLPVHTSPRKFLTHSAMTISKLLRLYKRTYGFRQVCNIVVYIAHTACTIHLLNLPDKMAARDIIHGLNHLEEISECWICARRTLGILAVVAKRWEVELPEAATRVFERNGSKVDVKSPSASSYSSERELDHQMLGNRDFGAPACGLANGFASNPMAQCSDFPPTSADAKTLGKSLSPTTTAQVPQIFSQRASFPLSSSNLLSNAAIHARHPSDTGFNHLNRPLNSQLNGQTQSEVMQPPFFKDDQQQSKRLSHFQPRSHQQLLGNSLNWTPPKSFAENNQANTQSNRNPAPRPINVGSSPEDDRQLSPSFTRSAMFPNGSASSIPDQDWWLRESNAFRGAWDLDNTSGNGMHDTDSYSTFLSNQTTLNSPQGQNNQLLNNSLLVNAPGSRLTAPAGAGQDGGANAQLPLDFSLGENSAMLNLPNLPLINEPGLNEDFNDVNCYSY